MWRLKNRTKYSNEFVRKLVSWCRKEVDLPAKWLKQVDFFNRSRGMLVNGTAWWKSRIMIRVGPNKGYPTEWEGAPMQDQISAIVFVTAHELQHIKNYNDGSHHKLTKDRDLEPHCNRIGRAVLKRFEENREALLAEWNESEKASSERAKPDVVGRRAAKAAEDLARWERKLKLAKSKVRKYKLRVGYYEKRLTRQECT